MSNAFNLSQLANNVNTSGQVANTGLQNNSVTVSAGTGLSGGGAVALGGTTTLTNAGVTSIAAGTGISVSGSTGAVTVSASSSGGGQVKSQLFTAPGTFTTPANCTSVKVLVVGGGGSGTNSGAGGQPSGGSSSFSTLVSATGGSGGPGSPGNSQGSNGSGTVSTGTALFTGTAGSLSFSQKSFMQGVFVGGVASQNSPGPQPGIAYTIGGGQAAGGGGCPQTNLTPTTTGSAGGAGGMALAICPVTASTGYPITVGSGGPSPFATAGYSGAVYLEYIG